VILKNTVTSGWASISVIPKRGFSAPGWKMKKGGDCAERAAIRALHRRIDSTVEIR
jgi:hypothetical protein